METTALMVTLAETTAMGRMGEPLPSTNKLVTSGMGTACASATAILSLKRDLDVC
jgi:hypothetical protein